MATHKSAAKRARQAVRKRVVNNRRKSSVKTHEKNLLTALASGNKTEVTKLLGTYMSEAMKAAKNGIIKAETASRKISRLSTKAANLLK